MLLVSAFLTLSRWQVIIVFDELKIKENLVYEDLDSLFADVGRPCISSGEVNHPPIATHILTLMIRGTLRVKKTCPKSRVLLSRFAASTCITSIHCARARTTVEDHGCTGKGRHATRTTTQCFSRPMPLLLLYHAPSFGCSSTYARTLQSTCMGVRNVIREFIWTAATVLFAQVRTGFLTRTVYSLTLNFPMPTSLLLT